MSLEKPQSTSVNFRPKRNLHHKEESRALPGQIGIVERRLQRSFTVPPNQEVTYSGLKEYGTVFGLEIRGNTVNHIGFGDMDFSTNTDYPPFLHELRHVRQLQYHAIVQALDPNMIQEYPIFIPIWYNTQSDYDLAKGNKFWLKNRGVAYFDTHPLKGDYFSELSYNSNIFYSHSTLGNGVGSLARALPDATITAGDINTAVIAVCKDYIAKQRITNVTNFVVAPSEYLPISDNSYDAVFTHQAIWTNAFRSFIEYVRIVRPEGIIVGSTVANENHDVITFFENFARIYKAQITIMSDEDFKMVKIQVSPELKQQIQVDSQVVEILSHALLPNGNNSMQFPQTYREYFSEYTIPKHNLLISLQSQGISLDEAQKSLKRLMLIAQDGSGANEGSGSSIAIKLLN